MHCAEEELLLNALGIVLFFFFKKKKSPFDSLFAPFPIPKCSALSFTSWKSVELYFCLQFQ